MLSGTKFYLTLIGMCFSATVKVKVNIKVVYMALLRKLITELRGVTCHMASHSLSCHPTQVNAPSLNPSQTGWYLIYLPRRDGRLS